MEDIDDCDLDNMDWTEELMSTVVQFANLGFPNAIKERDARLAMVSKEMGTPA